MILKRDGSRSASFSIIEMTVCISIIMLLASLILPRFTRRHDADLFADLDHLFSVIVYVQARAMATNTEQELFFDSENHSYYFIKNDKPHERKLHSKTRFGYLPHSMGPPSSPTELIITPITFRHKEGSNKISARFFPDGKISSGTLYLTDVKQTTMVALTTPISEIPYIRTYKFLDNQWILINHTRQR